MRNFLFFASAMLLIASQALAARRVLYIGDSITDGGWGRSGGSAKPASERNQKDLNHIYGQCFVWQCAAHYQSLHPDQDWQFWNRGISGNTLYQMAERWADDALSLKPDVISILIGTNEAGKSISAVEKSGRKATPEDFDYKKWEAVYRHLLDTTRQELPDVQLVLCTPFHTPARGEVKCAVIDSLCTIIRQMAKDYDAVLVPFDSMFKELRKDEPTPKYWIWDGIHPTAAGHLKMAELWQQKVDAAGLFISNIVSVQEYNSPLLLLAGDYADPTVLKDGDDYYMTHSPFHYQSGFLIWHSRDLIHWTPISRVKVEWEGSAWAPDLQKVGDTYYLYFPASGGNYVTTAKDIRGPWTEPVDLKIKGIDPGLAVTPDGKRYLFTNGGNVTPITDDGLARAGETQNVYQGWKYPVEWETECMCLESPKITYRNGWYYMTSAEGGTAGPATSHMAVCARSRSIMGPWENSPYNPIVHTYSADEHWWSKGHGTIVEGPDGQWWIIYHAYNKNAYSLGRNTLMEPIEWTEGGWYRPVKDKDLSQYKCQMPSLSDDFSKPEPGWQWTGWKEDITKFATINKGTLTLPGKGTTPAEARLMTLAAIDEQYAVETTVTLDKKNSKAGLLLFYSEKAYAGLMADGKHLTVYRDSAHTEQIANTLGRTIRIRLENHAKTLSVLVSKDGKQWQTLAADIDISAFHHNNLRDFLALRPSLCVMGDGKASFRDFKYISMKKKP